MHWICDIDLDIAGKIWYGYSMKNENGYRQTVQLASTKGGEKTMKIQGWINKLEELASKHPSGKDAQCVFTVHPSGNVEPYKCTVFAELHVAEEAGKDDLAYVDLEIDE